MTATVTAWLERIEKMHPVEIELGLERVRNVWLRSAWVKPAPTVITVAGTNGKGSTVAILEAILSVAGFRVGAYTSPHLLRYNERIRIDQKPIDNPGLISAFEQVEQLRQTTPLTYFEFGTLAALLAMAEAKLDIAILEVGLGGRLDATNIIDADGAIVTSIARDHVEWLGDDLEQIGREKAGVFRANAIAVGSAPALPKSIRATAEAVGAQWFERGVQFQVESTSTHWQVTSTSCDLSALEFPTLPGKHQLDNAAGALVLLHELGLLPSRAVINAALGQLCLAGRMQSIAGNPEIVLDVAHNPAGAERLVECLRRRQQPVCIVLGMLRDKEVQAFVRHFEALDLVGWFLASLPAPRGLDAEQLANQITSDAPIGAYDQPGLALAAARAAIPSDGLILVTGSFLTVAAILEITPTGEVEAL